MNPWRLDDPECPDCNQGKIAWCGLSKAEHKRLRKVRAEAQKQARELMLQSKEQQMLPQAILKEVYDQAERDVRRRLGR